MISRQIRRHTLRLRLEFCIRTTNKTGLECDAPAVSMVRSFRIWNFSEKRACDTKQDLALYRNSVIPQNSLSAQEKAQLTQFMVIMDLRTDDNIHRVANKQQILDELFHLMLTSSQYSKKYANLIRNYSASIARIFYRNAEYEKCYECLRLSRNSDISPAIYAGTLLMLGKELEFESFICGRSILTQCSIHQVDQLIRTVVQFYSNNKLDWEKSLRYWALICYRIYGHLELLDNQVYRQNLVALGTILDGYFLSCRVTANAQKRTKYIKLDEGKFSNLIGDLDTVTFAQLLTTIMKHCVYHGDRPKRLEFVLKLWRFKKERKLPLVSQDLTSSMRALVEFNQFEDAFRLHELHPELHDDSQFDSLLRCHGSLNEWNKMQKQFEDLFGKGELPSIYHYGIVMNALGNRGEIKAVEMLYEQLLTRGMIPNAHILAALMKCQITYGDFEGAIQTFNDKFSQFNIRKNGYIYWLIFQAYKGLGNIHEPFEIVKQLVKSDRIQTLSHKDLLPLMGICRRLGDHLNASFLYFRFFPSIGIQPNLKMTLEFIETCLKARKLGLADFLIKKILKSFHNSDRFSTNFHNSIINFHLTSKNYQKAIRHFNENMIQNPKIKPNGRTFGLLIEILILAKRFKQVCKLFVTMQKWVVPSEYHYATAMRTALKLGNGKLALKYYNQMLFKKVSPGLSSYVYLIRALISNVPVNKDEVLNSKTQSVITSILDDLIEQKKKETLSQPIKYLPLQLVVPFIKKLASVEKTGEAKTFAEKFIKMLPPDSISSYLFLEALLAIYAEEANWQIFELIFDLYVKSLATQLNRPVEKDSDFSDSNVRAAYLVANRLSTVWAVKLRHMIQVKNYKSIIPLLRHLESIGFKLSNYAMNETARSLLIHHTTLEDALEFIEGRLIKGYLFLKSKRKLVREKQSELDRSALQTMLRLRPHTSYYLSGATYFQTLRAIEKFISQRVEGKERAQVLMRFKHLYPMTMARYDDNISQLDEWERITQENRSLDFKIKKKNPAVRPERLVPHVLQTKKNTANDDGEPVSPVHIEARHN
ncbi:COX1 mRNA translational activator [Komagataella phaffii CBS 7435]|uniref:Mitochondrial 15S rRNA processing factor CCM1 n=1 Tax=Komagataella phaffii (strain ATCC 76273 / CBS 7435 / CECT 11047 / NRRL Y-11430 / Wegner 21-1) TaxID=981350 RepID=F2QXX7_KOMPC|nr:GQ68_05250T0 [Komagataella phaffii GS115]CAH2450447.1 COX1 mRNA translational activator [Komagataella phaffii CBS 7435]CCA40255.1 COX1 mRNA translational activator [Komagataella phaffii CBS 7435]